MLVDKVYWLLSGRSVDVIDVEGDVQSQGTEFRFVSLAAAIVNVNSNSQ